VLTGAGYIFFAYIGFDSVSTHAEEARNPQRDVPIGIVASLAICTVLYILVAGVLTGMVRYDQIDIHAPVARAFADRGMPAAVFLISVGAVVGITSVLLVLLLSQSRVLLAMARDGLIPRSFFAAVHPRFQTPHKATILTGVIGDRRGALPVEGLADLVNIGTLMAFGVVCLGHRDAPDAPRPAPPVSDALVHRPDPRHPDEPGDDVFPRRRWVRLGVQLLIGFAIYFGYGQKRSDAARAGGRAREERDRKGARGGRRRCECQ
jgi:APA family basic amino acid/polyamine antiporter